MEQIFDIIRTMHQAGTTILLVEQNAQMALSVAHRGYVLETGRIVTTGTGSRPAGGREREEGVSGRVSKIFPYSITSGLPGRGGRLFELCQRSPSEAFLTGGCMTDGARFLAKKPPHPS